MAVVPAANSAEMAMPPRISRPIEPRWAPLHAIASTTATASSPNASAPTGSSAIFSGKASRISTAPKPAPAVTPITSGEASGLVSAPCSSAPATPSEAPTRTAVSVRGSRSCSTISRSGPGSARPSSASTTSAAGTRTAPKASEATSAAASAAAEIATTASGRSTVTRCAGTSSARRG